MLRPLTSLALAFALTAPALAQVRPAPSATPASQPAEATSPDSTAPAVEGHAVRPRPKKKETVKPTGNVDLPETLGEILTVE